MSDVVPEKAAVLPRRPGGPCASRPLHFIWLVDASGSMGTQGRMRAVNDAIRSTIPALRQVSLDYPQAAVYANAIRFGDDARWLREKLTPLSEFHWQEMEAGGLTALGEALTMVGDALQPPLIRGRALPPILILITDGLPTDDFQAGLDHLLGKPWGKRSVRVALTLSRDEEVRKILGRFVSGETPPLEANTPALLANRLRRATVSALKSVCAPDAVKPPGEKEAVPVENDPGGW